MRIQQAEAFRYSLSNDLAGGDEQSNGFTSSTPSAREGLLIRLTSTSGLEAWGDVAPLPGRSRETIDEAQSEVLGLTELLLDKEIPRNWDELVTMQPGVDCAASVAFGVEHAIVELASRSIGIPAPLWITPHPRPFVSINALLSGSPSDMYAAAVSRRTEGYTAFKMKVGPGSPTEIRAAVEAVRMAIGEEAELRLDANRAWTYDHAANVLRGLEDLDIAFIEEPLVDHTDLERLTADTAVPIAIDETVSELYYREFSARDFQFLKAVVLKPTMVGGMVYCMKLAEEFIEAGIESVVTSAYESEVGLSGLATLAAALPGSGWPAGLDTQRLFGLGILEMADSERETTKNPWFRQPVYDYYRDIGPAIDRARLTNIDRIRSESL